MRQAPEDTRRSLMRAVSDEALEPSPSPGGERLARREAVLHALAMSRRRQRRSSRAR